MEAILQNWLISHPLVSILMLPLLWLLLAGLLKVIANLSEKFWVALLHFPVKLSELILSAIRKIFKIPHKSSTVQEDRLAEIVKRLTELKKEQDQLWQEMNNIVENK